MANVTDHCKETANYPDDEGEVDAASTLEDPGGGDEDATADDTADNDRTAVHESHLRLELDVILLLLAVYRLLPHRQHLHLRGLRLVFLLFGGAHGVLVGSDLGLIWV